MEINGSSQSTTVIGDLERSLLIAQTIVSGHGTVTMGAKPGIPPFR